MRKCYCGVHENGHCRLVWVDDSAYAREDGTALLVQVESSTVCGLVTVDRNRSRLWMWRVPISVGLWILREAQIGLGLNLGLEWV